MDQVNLRGSGLTVSRIGLGCMGMSEFYGPADPGESRRTFDSALELGVTFLDTADMYGSGANERLIGGFIKGRRDRVVVATKFGIVRDPANPSARKINGRPDYVRAACDASLRRLGVEVIDLYYAHRLDPDVPVEETVGAMAELMRAGKVRALGLSEVSLAELDRAMAVHPIAAVQSELSLWSRDHEPMERRCAELGISFVPYSPLGRGLLAGAVRAEADLAQDDFRRSLPRFQGENLERNLLLAGHLATLAQARGATPAQLALAWLLAKGPHVVPIPGTRRVERIEENAAAAGIALSAEEVAALEQTADAGAVAGSRYPDWVLARTHEEARIER
jgi:aryl-alcohol dehydrogenase-like predicted oxidoreductase